MEIKKVKNKEELDILLGKNASFERLNFSFTEEYLNKLKNSLSNGLQFFAFEEKEFAGYIASIKSTNWSGQLEIIELFVEPKYQGKGIGQQLIDKIVETAKADSLLGIIVQTEKENIPAQRLYEKKGFELIDNPNWNDGLTYSLFFGEDDD